MTTTEAQAYCTTVTQQSGSNFYYSFFFLPPQRRQAMHAVYAFCKEIDSVVDDPPPGSDPQEALGRWRAELDAAYQGHPAYPVTICLVEHAHQLGIPKEYCEALIDGVEMDLTTSRYATFDDLAVYCYRVASVVGLICLKVFGTRSPRASEYAINLGMAFQLTNILRDLGSDADRGRIYVPLEDLARFKYSEDALLKKTYSPAFIELMRCECARARQFYEKAHEVFVSLSPEDQRTLTVAEIMRSVYARILSRIEDSGYRVFGPGISMPSAYRLVLAAGVWLRSRCL